MRKMILGAIFVMVVQGAALAQGASERRGWGYVFGGAGASSGDFSTGFFQFGAGGEGLVNNGFGLGAEIGYLAPFRASGDGIGLFSRPGHPIGPDAEGCLVLPRTERGIFEFLFDRLGGRDGDHAVTHEVDARKDYDCTGELSERW